MDNESIAKLGLVSKIKSISKEINKISNIYLQYDELNASQRSILEILYNEGALTVPNIAKSYNSSRQHVQVNVNSLLKKGFITQEENSFHIKSKLINLNKKGKEVIEDVLEFEKKFILDLFENIQDEDLENMEESLNEISQKCEEILRAIR